MLAAAALFSTGGAAIKSCQWDSWQVAGFRSGIAALTLLFFFPPARRRWSWKAALVGCAYAATLVLFVTANKLTTSAATIFLQSTAPLYLLLLGPWLLAEPVRRRDLIVLAALLAGLAMMFAGADPPQTTAPDPLRGNIFAALAGVSWALCIAGLRWLGRGGAHAAAPAVTLGNIIAFAVCLPFAWPLEQARAGDVAVGIYLGVVQIALAYIFLTLGIERVRALEASLLLLLEPMLNPVWSWLVHGERPSAWTLVGGGLILAATTAQSILARRGHRPAPPGR